MKEWYEVIGHPKGIMIIKALTTGIHSFRSLLEKTGGSTTTINNLVREMDYMGIVKDQMKNEFPRTREISLTEKGQKVAEKLREIEKIMEE